MGFPTWTLMGMGVTFMGALLMVMLAYIAQSPGFAARIGLGGTRIVYRVKTFTAYALAFMVLCMGFFVAGVPLDPALTATAVPDPTATTLADISALLPGSTSITLTQPVTTSLELLLTPDPDAVQTPSSGAFGGPPGGSISAGDTAAAETPLPEEGVSEEGAPPEEGASEEGLPLETGEGTAAITVTVATESVPTGTSTPTSTPAPSTPTPPSTPTATATATPTITPTPIDGETAVLNLGGSVTWLRRSPGGQNMTLLHDQEVVILHPGRANRAGILWREVATGGGVVGWVEAQFLQVAEE